MRNVWWLASLQKALCFTSDNKFFIGRNYQQLHTRMVGADDGLGGARRLILLWVENDAQLIEVCADFLTEFCTIFTDAGRENDCVRTIQLEEIAAYPLSRAGHEHL